MEGLKLLSQEKDLLHVHVTPYLLYVHPRIFKGVELIKFMDSLTQIYQIKNEDLTKSFNQYTCTCKCIVGTGDLYEGQGCA